MVTKLGNIREMTEESASACEVKAKAKGRNGTPVAHHISIIGI